MERQVPPEAVAAYLERLLGSATFRGAERSRSLLRFIVEEALQGRADRLKDYTLGSEALGRGEQFDPRTDPIARVEASRRRSSSRSSNHFPFRPRFQCFIRGRWNSSWPLREWPARWH
jgi:hypothetical protein